MYKTVPAHIEAYDTYSYVEGYQVNLLKGEVDALRTPVYPCFIRLIRKIGGAENVYQNVALFRKLLFIITIVLFYYCLKKITNCKLVICVLTILFGISPFLVFWNVMILTEALSVFEIVLLSLLTISYLKKPNKIVAGSIRSGSIRYDYDKAIFHLFTSYLFLILDTKVFLRQTRKKRSEIWSYFLCHL